MVRVRVAPAPTGSMHLGNVLGAVANRRFADEHGGSLLLTGRERGPELWAVIASLPRDELLRRALP